MKREGNLGREGRLCLQRTGNWLNLLTSELKHVLKNLFFISHSLSDVLEMTLVLLYLLVYF